MCPLCGLHHSIKNYDPEDLPLDIEAVLKVGLGRGKGTRVVDRYSLLWDDDVSPKVVKRVLTLCSFFLNQNRITQGDLKRSLGIVDAPQPATVGLWEYNRLREDMEALKVQTETDGRRADRESNRAKNLLMTLNSLHGKVKDLETQLSISKSSTSRLEKKLEEMEASVENSNEALDNVIELIEKRTEFMFNPTDDSREEFIAYVIPRLLEDIEALKAVD
jgi:DNA-binding MarR family transcriptional regulator